MESRLLGGNWHSFVALMSIVVTAGCDSSSNLSPDAALIDIPEVDAVDALGDVDDGPCDFGSFGTPHPIPVDVSGFYFSGSPTLTADELTLYAHGRPPGEDFTIMRATRSNVSQAFSDLEPVLAFDNETDSFDPSISADGATIYFGRRDNEDSSSNEIYVAHKTNGAFGAPVKVANINDPDFGDNGAHISADELTLVFDSQRTGFGDLYHAVRSAPSAECETPVLLPALSSPDHEERHPTLSEDGLEIFFARRVPGERYDIMTATKPELDTAFSTPVPVEGLNTGGDDWHPFLSRDGHTIYFSRLPEGTAAATLWYATRDCE
jgi:hypothetical protein